MVLQKTIKKSVSIADKVSSLNVVESSINSPLHRFVRAKKRINQTFDEILQYLKESRQFLIDCEISDQYDVEAKRDLEKVDVYLTQVIGIHEVLKRDHMKVAFFGRTSNGKSTVINAMLSERILPAGIGHTTNCFLSVVGAESNEAYMEDTSKFPPERKSVESLQQLAHALHNQKLDCSSHLKVYWPTSKCPLLKDDVVFVDSPGVDVTPDLDTWIDTHCLDADVFVLVVNSESTINHTEKSFFHKVKSKLSKPNIFILNNRWDASAEGDPEMIKLVKQQHMERTSEFLVKELKCISQNESSDRIFFVSALETLRHRMSIKRSKMPHREPSIDENADFDEAAYRMGKMARRQEFEDFENKFKECISKSAISTKFNSHTSTGISIAREMVRNMEQIIARASSHRSWCTAERQEQQETFDFIDSKLEEVTGQIKSKIQSIAEEVEMQVSKAMSDEIRRLGTLVGEFDYPFHPHSGFLQNYKKELHGYIEKGLGKNLKARCSQPLIESIDEYKAEMQDQIFSLIPTSACTSTITMSPRTNFAVSYELEVENLCSDFHEDITFRFSFGWTALVNKFIAPRNPRLAILFGAAVSTRQSLVPYESSWKREKRNLKSIPSESRSLTKETDPEIVQSRYVREDSTNEEMIQSISRQEEDQLTIAVIQGLGSLGSSTAMGLVVAGSLVWRTVGWKIIAGGAACYFAIYMYEKAMWTNAAKEKYFKKQFVEYASEKLQMVVSFTSKGCSHQIQQELSCTFSQLASMVDSAKEKIRSRIEELDEEIVKMKEIESKAKLFKNKASWVESDLNAFIKEFNLVTPPFNEASKL